MFNNLLRLSENKGSIGDRFRAQRFKQFESLLTHLPKPIRILDVGGTESFWLNRGYDKKKEIHLVLLNLQKVDVKSKNMVSVQGDAINLSQFKDNEFDIVFSNSVIEHLYSFENQTKMAKECMRVGKFYYIQTPNKFFFIEPHFRLPFFNFLPKKSAQLILTKTKFSLGKKWTEKEANETLAEIRLLSKREYIKLFDGAQIYTERFLGFAKSFIVHNIVEK